METLNVQDFADILKNVTEIITENCTKLCELDSVVGDGDHRFGGVDDVVV